MFLLAIVLTPVWGKCVSAGYSPHTAVGEMCFCWLVLTPLWGECVSAGLSLHRCRGKFVSAGLFLHRCRGKCVRPSCPYTVVRGNWFLLACPYLHRCQWTFVSAVCVLIVLFGGEMMYFVYVVIRINTITRTPDCFGFV